jgi:thioredoxin reductase (NADPH)
MQFSFEIPNSSLKKDNYDVVIIGGGPAGLSAAIYLSRFGLSNVVIEKDIIGGQINLTSEIENYPGFPEGITGEELSAKMEEQAKKFGSEIADDTVEKLEKIKDGFKVYLSGDKFVEAKAVFLATGAAPRKLGLPNEDKFTGKGISYCAVCDAAFFKGKKIVAVGGGNTALEEAIYLSDFASELILVHRRDKFRGEKILVDRLNEKPNAKTIMNSVIDEIKGVDRLESVVLKNVLTGEKTEIKTDGLFIFIGYSPNYHLVENLADIEHGFVETDKYCETSTPRLFAIGDVRNKRLKQVATAVADGAIAAEYCYRKYFEPY